jgi:hypothetical protein
MLNNNDFIALERRLWAEGNPLCDELVSTRDELLHLLSISKKILQKYSPAINELSTVDDLEFFREWDAFGDTLDNISYDLGLENEIQYKLHEVTK